MDFLKQKHPRPTTLLTLGKPEPCYIMGRGGAVRASPEVPSKDQQLLANTQPRAFIRNKWGTRKDRPETNWNLYTYIVLERQDVPPHGYWSVRMSLLRGVGTFGGIAIFYEFPICNPMMKLCFLPPKIDESNDISVPVLVSSSLSEWDSFLP